MQRCVSYLALDGSMFAPSLVTLNKSPLDMSLTAVHLSDASMVLLAVLGGATGYISSP